MPWIEKLWPALPSYVPPVSMGIPGRRDERNKKVDKSFWIYYQIF
jgi:hypothetical protein